MSDSPTVGLIYAAGISAGIAGQAELQHDLAHVLIANIDEASLVLEGAHIATSQLLNINRERVAFSGVTLERIENNWTFTLDDSLTGCVRKALGQALQMICLHANLAAETVEAAMSGESFDIGFAADDLAGLAQGVTDEDLCQLIRSQMYLTGCIALEMKS